MTNVPLRVRNLIKRHGTANPSKICADLKIEIMYCETPQKINGFWRRFNKRKYIGVNDSLVEEWQSQAVVAHELAHILLHPGYTSYSMTGRVYYSCTRYENEADEFAAELVAHAYGIEKEYVLNFLKHGYKVKRHGNSRVL